MTRTQKRRLMWNGVIYGFAFATALVVAAVLRPAHDLASLTTLAPAAGSASIDAPAAATSPVRSVGEFIVP